MRHLAPALVVALLAGCTATATGSVTPGSSASPSTSASPKASNAPGASTAPAASASPAASARPGAVATVVPGTSVAVPVTAKLTVDGKPGEIEPLASFHNAPGSNGSIFWDMGIYAKTPGQQPTGALAEGKFTCTVHFAAANADPNFFANVRTLTDAEFMQAVKFTLREGVMNESPKILITREWYMDFRTPDSGLKGSLTRTGDTATFKIAGKMPEDKYNGKAHEVDLEVSGLPLP